MADPEPSFEDKFGLRFNDKSLLLRALTHPSYLNENPGEGLEDNERLEFLGDAVLDFVSGEWLYHHFPEAPEGRLTRLRAALVRTETLARFARESNLGAALRLGHGEEESGGRQRDGNLCGAFEALVGALYLDQGTEAVRVFVEPMFELALQALAESDQDKDPKSLLQEWSQAHLGVTPVYETTATRGPDHAKEFTVTVYLGNQSYGAGTGHSKQAAAQQAARQALRRIYGEDRAWGEF